MLPTEFPVPTLFARIGPRLPQKPWSLALALSLNATRQLGKLPDDVSFMAGRSVAICVQDLGATATITLQPNGRFAPSTGTADVRFTAQLADLVRIIRRQEDPDTLFFQRRLLIEGDTELGLTLKNLLDSIELPAWLMTHS
ncbi:hypothetical protein GCM10025770_39900 [Viridibacterium curvum]|uniref:Ubiquinone biosynthesis accessory factor UbiT n=1 Tax=Viridibacterium curvum TaxID=1101404 RepID=A0ABP9R9B1_9RHOO